MYTYGIINCSRLLLYYKIRVRTYDGPKAIVAEYGEVLLFDQLCAWAIPHTGAKSVVHEILKDIDYHKYDPSSWTQLVEVLEPVVDAGATIFREVLPKDDMHYHYTMHQFDYNRNILTVEASGFEL